MKRFVTCLLLWVVATTSWAICPNIPSRGLSFLTAPTLGTVSSNAPSLGHSETLPIEVLGPPGTVESYHLPALSDAASVTAIYFQVHNLSFEGKMSFRLNENPWRTLTDDNVIYPRPEAGFFGMGGILDTLRFLVPLKPGEVMNGTNVVHFRFNDLDGKTVGYRVLALNLMAGPREVFPRSAFAYDDPSTWTNPAPYDSPEAIREGQRIWYNETISEAGRTLKAHCTDCHAHDGRDLRYFNYSRRSIVERSRFHGLSTEMANQVASYILSLAVPYEKGARPWNPPYQPAPGLDSQPVRSWAAGGGLQAVLENDLDTLKYLFPGGASTNSIDLTKIINTREIPLAVQFPSWNRWLPKVHPLDQREGSPNDPFLKTYANITNRLRLLGRPEAAAFFARQSSPWDAASRRTIAKPATSDPTYRTWAEEERDRRHWRVVKVWEIMTEFEMEERGHELFGPESNNRRWFHGEVFRLGPHVIGLPKYDSFHAESMQWYQVQLVLNDGNRRNGSIVPIDWGYQHALNHSSWDNPTNLTTYAVLALNTAKGIEVGANGLPLTENHSWNPFKADIYRLAPGNILRGKYATIPVETRRQVAEALLEPWLDQCERFSRDDYLAKKNFKLDDKFRAWLMFLATNFDEIGVSPVLINRIADFGVRLYPDDDWSKARPGQVRPKRVVREKTAAPKKAPSDQPKPAKAPKKPKVKGGTPANPAPTSPP